MLGVVIMVSFLGSKATKGNAGSNRACVLNAISLRSGNGLWQLRYLLVKYIFNSQCKSSNNFMT